MPDKSLTKYDVARLFSAGFATALLPDFRDTAEGEHWLAGWDAGYKYRGQRTDELNAYLEKIGMDRMAVVKLCDITPGLEQELPVEPISLEAKLHVYGMAYHKQCEDYDRTVCTGKSRRGVAMPNNSTELGLVNRHATTVLKTLASQLAVSGLVPRQDAERKLLEAIRSTPKTFEKGLADDHTTIT